MRVLLTGHEGYIGSVLAPRLAAAGHDVRGLDAGLFTDGVLGAAPPAVPGPTKDARDASPEDLAGCGAVVHLAGLCNDSSGDIDPLVTDDVDRAAVIRLARLAKDAGVERFLFASTCGVYGAAGETGLVEESPLNPLTAYGRAKARAEAELAALSDERFTPVTLRLGTVYGASPRMRLDSLLNELTARTLLSGRVKLRSLGTGWRPMVHVEDAARAFHAALEAAPSRVRGQVFNVGRTEENYRVRELADVVREELGAPGVEFEPGAPPDRLSYRVICTKLAGWVPDFRPGWDVRRGVKELAECFRRNGLTEEAFEGPLYRRADRLRGLLAEGRLDRSLRRVG
jgi:nucleoside-diphosphate-sugar epimerase